MKQILTTLLLLLLTITSIHSQIIDPVKWETSVEKNSETEYTLVATATIESGWHLYSQEVPEDGPIPTTFTFYTNDNFELVGNTTEEEGITVDDAVFNMKIKYFENKAAFKQRIRILNNELSVVKGEAEFMACDDAQCTPPTTRDFVFNIKAGVANGADKVDATSEVAKDHAETNSIENAETNTTPKESNKGLWTIFFIAFFIT